MFETAVTARGGPGRLSPNENVFYFGAMGTPVIVSAVRTPIGKRRGHLAGLHELADPLPRRTSLSSSAPASVVSGAAEVEQVIGGLRDAGGRAVQLNSYDGPGCSRAFPEHTAGTDDRRAVGLERAAVDDLVARADPHAGAIDTGIACGVEMMSRIPLGANVPQGTGTRGPGWYARHAQPVPRRRPDRDDRGISREDLEAFGLASQQKARVAVDEGRFKREISR